MNNSMNNIRFANTIIILLGLCFIPACVDTNRSGWDALNSGNFTEAEKQFKLYLQNRNKELRFGYNGLGRAYLKQGKYSEAEPLLLKALTLWERELGRDNLVVAGILGDLGTLYAKQGNLLQAIPYFRRKLEIESNEIPDPSLTQEMVVLADILRNQGKYQSAEPLYVRTIAILTKWKETDRTEMVGALEGYAALLRETSRSEEAVPLEHRAIVIRSKIKTRSPTQ